MKEPLLQSPSGPFWKTIGIYPHHGINLLLSSLHSQYSCGIGEFYDLIPLVDWCKSLTLDVIQLLPLNNLTDDPSPYNANSSCALNPLNLSLYALPHLDELPLLQQQLKQLRVRLNSERIDYREVAKEKRSWLKQYSEAVGDRIIDSLEAKDFLIRNPWVKDFDPLLQYLCFSQMTHVKQYANTQGVFLMGDIPILVSKESVDVKEHPEYFNQSLTAGAPPDLYNKKGQNWGFPLFCWHVLKEHHFFWWKRRLHYASHFYNLYRIDHVVGFFRIWGIPLGLPATDGYFVPEDESLWQCQGKELLTMMNASSPMLAIAEDLGLIPPCVKPILEEMGIPGTKVMRWERQEQADTPFIPIDAYPQISLTTLSTHDSETLQLWWKSFPEEAALLAKQKQWPYAPDLSLAQRKELLWDSHHTTSLFHINLLQEYLALFPDLVSNNPEDERINIPGTVLPTNWTYRFRPTVEEITSHPGLFQAMKEIISYD